MPPKNKNKAFLKKQKEADEAKAKKKTLEDAAKAEAAEAASKGRKTPEELGFFVRSGPDAALRANLDMDIQVENITLYGGKQELISCGILKLVYGVHYGLVGRNGVGKSTLLRAIA
ncbi:hypothetical protein CYMTET_30826, partial [Cymbomonas tetramitiformis]